MNETSFQVGDRVRHKVTKIESEIVQLEESLAMPHVWVIEPSELEINADKLYRLVDLEKLEDSGEGAQKTNQAQRTNPNISLSDREAEVNSLTSNDFSGEPVLTVEEETTTVSTELEFPVLTVENDTTTVSTGVESPVLTVEPELITLCCESVSGEQIASKLIPVTVRSRSDTVGNTSTLKEFPRQSVLTVEDDSTTVSTEPEFPVLTVEPELVTLRSESVSGEQITSKPLPISVRSSSNPAGNTSTSNELSRQPVLTVDSDTTTVSTKLELPVLTVDSDTTTVSTKLELPVLTVDSDTTTVNTKLELPVLTVDSDTTTVSTELESPVLTVDSDTTTVSTELESPVLTVEPELVTLRSESVRSEQIASKLLPISVRSSSNPAGNTSTSNELPRQPVLTVTSDTTTVSTELESPVLTVESGTTTVSTEAESFVLTAEPAINNPGGDLRDCSQVENDTTHLGSEETTQGSNKRRKGEGTGRIQLRTITKKNGKQYQQFWYDWQVHTKEKIIYKSVYIPKRLLEKIQELESTKVAITEILKILNKTL